MPFNLALVILCIFKIGQSNNLTNPVEHVGYVQRNITILFIITDFDECVIYYRIQRIQKINDEFFLTFKIYHCRNLEHSVREISKY